MTDVTEATNWAYRVADFLADAGRRMVRDGVPLEENEARDIAYMDWWDSHRVTTAWKVPAAYPGYLAGWDAGVLFERERVAHSGDGVAKRDDLLQPQSDELRASRP